MSTITPANLTPVITETNEILDALPDVKPGIQTTEFALASACSLAIVILVAIGKLDGAWAALALPAIAGWYQKLRNDDKINHRNAAVDTVIAAKQLAVVNPAPAPVTTSPATVEEQPMSIPHSGPLPPTAAQLAEADATPTNITQLPPAK